MDPYWKEKLGELAIDWCIALVIIYLIVAML